MEFTELIHKRQSVRSYDPHRKVEREVILRILEAGRAAPSAANMQPWRFIVVETEPLLSRVKASYVRDWIARAPHILVVLGSIRNCWRRSYDGYLSIETDLAIAMDHMILAAANEGVGACWVEAFDPDKLRDALNLTLEDRVFAFTPLGYPVEGWTNPKPKVRKPASEVFEFR